jgi:cytidylate kinase
METMTNLNHVIFAGLSFTGKTTHSKYISKVLGYQYISGSQIRASHLGVSELVDKNPSFWRESDTATLLDKRRLSNDKESETSIEDELVRLMQIKTRCVFDTWGLPWIYNENSLCIYLRSAMQVRINRAFRESRNLPVQNIEKRIIQKDNDARKYFLQTYGFDIVTNIEPFDIIIGSNENDIKNIDNCRLAVSESIVSIVKYAEKYGIIKIADMLKILPRIQDCYCQFRFQGRLSKE